MTWIPSVKLFPGATRPWHPVWLAALLAACEPAPPPGATEPLDLHQPQYTGAGVAGCHVCHAGDFNRAIAGTPHGDAGNPATPYGQHGCESCHGAGSFHVSRAYGGKGLPPLIRFGAGGGAAPREIQLGVCQACHDEKAAGRAAIGFTGSTHDFRYVTCSTCHAMHAAVEPLSEPARQADICLECHRSQRTEHPQVRGRTVDFAIRACSACHDIHPAAGDDEETEFDF